MLSRHRLLPAALCGAFALLPASAAEPGAGRAFADADLAWNPCPAFLPAGCGIAVLDGDPAGRDADVFFRVPGGAVIPRHWHSSTERMVLVAGRLRVSYDGKAPMRLEPGQYARGAARAPHSAVCESREPCVLFIAFDGPVDAIEGGAPVSDAAP
jgi:mannose-6-phosphate isomerase-like protein (cupin superfamily)